MATTKQKQRIAATAYHEAGHVALAIEFEQRLKYATIKPDRDAGFAGVVHHHKIGKWFRPDIDVDSARTQKRLLEEIMGFYAGVIAEKKFTGKRTNHAGAAYDYHEAVGLAMRFAASGAETTALLRWLRIRTERLVERRWETTVRPIAEALIERQTLSESDIRAVLNQNTERLMAERTAARVDARR